MWFSLSEHFAVTAYSLFMGVFLGVLYDCIRLTRILCGIGSYSRAVSGLYKKQLPFIKNRRISAAPRRKNMILLFLGDILYALLCSASYSLFLFHAIRGQVRWYFLLASAIGFFLYYFTVSKLVLSILEILFFF
ncbi:MAG: hypothetical protein E7575_07970, partial [Ruminococcaceae bacterium]|nr:hypothetical protein [Oscillospiraceae bacterium]